MNALINKLAPDLDSYWMKLVNELKDSLKDSGLYASGNTYQSIGAFNSNPVVINSKGFNITVGMPKYYQFLDEGVSGAKYNTGVSRFRYKNKYPNIDAIKTYMQNRGINPQVPNTKSGKSRTKEQMIDTVAFLIARKIYEHGTRKTNFYSDVINDEQILKFENMFIDLYRKYAIELFDEK